MEDPKIVLITGTSSGFGLATAVHLASKGHKVIATMRNLNKKDTLLEEVKKNNCSVDILELDVTDNQSIHNACNKVAQDYGYIDVLINNAGYGIGGAFEDLTELEIRQQMETNFFGVQNVTRTFLPLIRSRKKGKIINISSVSGFSALPHFSAYNASKWALEGFSESLQYELKEFGIEVYLVEPGTYKTPIFYENARYAKNFDNKESCYYPYSVHLRKRTMDYVEDCHKDIKEVALLVEQLIMREGMNFRNIPDLESKFLYLLRKFLPFSWYRGIVRKALYSKMKKD